MKNGNAVGKAGVHRVLDGETHAHRFRSFSPGKCLRLAKRLHPVGGRMGRSRCRTAPPRRIDNPAIHMPCPIAGAHPDPDRRGLLELDLHRQERLRIKHGVGDCLLDRVQIRDDDNFFHVIDAARVNRQRNGHLVFGVVRCQKPDAVIKDDRPA